jgi:hypothetical protein
MRATGGATLETYTITPDVDKVREFLEIAGDFTNPLEIIREAVSNSVDAGATKISIEFSAEKEVGAYVLSIRIEDDGCGMDAKDLQSFFDLGNSGKRGHSQFIGEKGHGTKVFFNCASIAVETSKNGTALSATMTNPYATLDSGKLPEARVTQMKTDKPAGTIILIKGFNNNQGELFTHERLKDYIRWFTKFGSCEKEFGVSENNSKVIRLKGLDAKDTEVIPFGHFFPEESKPIQDLFNAYVVRAPDYYCKKVVRSGTLRRHPFVHYDAIFCIEGNRVKQTYNNMLRRQGYTAPAGAYTVQERYGIWLCKDFIPIERRNEWIALKEANSQNFMLFSTVSIFR